MHFSYGFPGLFAPRGSRGAVNLLAAYRRCKWANRQHFLLCEYNLWNDDFFFRPRGLFLLGTLAGYTAEGNNYGCSSGYGNNLFEGYFRLGIFRNGKFKEILLVMGSCANK